MQTKKSIDTICCVAGRSGGHIIPCLSWAHQNNARTILFFSTHNALDKQLLKDELVKHIPLTLNNIPYKNPLRMIQFAWHFANAFIKSLYYLHTYKPTKILSTGGYIALPVCSAARCLRIPIELFELNVSPGKATKFLAPIASRINICFEQSKRYFPEKKCVIQPYPLRFTQKQYTTDYADFRLDATKKTVMILGGSQGSQFLNEIIKEWVAHTNKSDIQIIHQTGTHTQQWEGFYKKMNIPAFVFNYYAHLEDLYPLTNVVICRSGAGTLFETLYFKKPCITIPLETATTAHQTENAYALAQQYPELVKMIKQKDIERAKNNFFTSIETTLLK